jgi:uncharacterized protein
MAEPAPQVVNNTDASRFELHVDGRIGILEYSVDGDRLRLFHTEVPRELRGRKLGEVLARAGLDYALSEHLRVVPICPFVRAYLTRHPEYESLVDEHWKAPPE